MRSDPWDPRPRCASQYLLLRETIDESGRSWAGNGASLQRTRLGTARRGGMGGSNSGFGTAGPVQHELEQHSLVGGRSQACPCGLCQSMERERLTATRIGRLTRAWSCRGPGRFGRRDVCSRLGFAAASAGPRSSSAARYVATPRNELMVVAPPGFSPPTAFPR